MPEREFDLYLSLLSRFLKLNASQRGDISDELRTHLEDRLDELAARGLSREQAIHTALEELGDAAELAQHFTRAAHIRRRRFIMRCTYGTVAALVAALLVGTAFWPQGPQGVLPVMAVANDPNRPTQAEVIASVEATNSQQTAAELRLAASLDKPTEVAFQETALEDALRYLKEFHDINIILDRPALKDEGIAFDSPVSLYVSGITFRSVLKLMLEPLQLTYIIEDEVMKVTTMDNAIGMIRVYNVRDLAEMRVPGDTRPAGMSAAMGMDMGMDMEIDMGMGQGVIAASAPCGSALASVVMRTIWPGTWTDKQNGGSVMEYKGLLIVKHAPCVHDKVKALLKLMRESAALR